MWWGLYHLLSSLQLLNTLWSRCYCHQHFIDEEIKLSKQRGWATWLMKAGVWICEQVSPTAWCTLLPHPHPPHMLLLVQAWLMLVCTWTLSLPCHIRPLTIEQSLHALLDLTVCSPCWQQSDPFKMKVCSSHSSAETFKGPSAPGCSGPGLLCSLLSFPLGSRSVTPRFSFHS